MPRVRRLYGIVDCGLPKNDKILQVSAEARWLFVLLILDCKLLDNGGKLTTRQAVACGESQVSNVRECLDDLVHVELLARKGEELVIPSWSKWNESAEERAKKLEADRTRKAAAKNRRQDERDT